MRESDLLRHIYRANRSLPSRVTIPPGDDMAMLRLDGAEVLSSVDQIADGVHFDLDTTPLEKIARKAITRNLSDVAAMAAAPTASLVAACLPRGMTDEQALELSDALAATADAYGCPLIGGDVSVWDHPLLLSVTVLAQTHGREPIRRSGARPGDAVCVTGRLGGSLLTVDGYTHHLDFEPRLAVAETLAKNPRLDIHCMIDLSDGLAADLPRLCHADPASPLAAEIDTSRLPLSPAAATAAERDGQPAWKHALGDGEDYELCFTLPKDQAQRDLPVQIEGVPITCVGRIVLASDLPTTTLRLIRGDGTATDLSSGDLGWEHHS